MENISKCEVQPIVLMGKFISDIISSKIENGEAIANFSYSTDGETFTETGESFTTRKGRRIGAKVGIFASRPAENYDSGFADYEWFRITPNETKN